jgi:hypothetical protein
VSRTDALVDVRRTLHERLIGRVDARQLDAMPRAERRLRVREEALSLLREQGHMLPQSALADVVNAVSDAIVEMGPIEFLLKDLKQARAATFALVDVITRFAYLSEIWFSTRSETVCRDSSGSRVAAAYRSRTIRAGRSVRHDSARNAPSVSKSAVSASMYNMSPGTSDDFTMNPTLPIPLIPEGTLPTLERSSGQTCPASSCSVPSADTTDQV